MVPDPSSCDLCMHTTQARNVVTRTLLFHIYYSCVGSVTGPCTHNHTTYLVCSHGNQHTCFNHTHCSLEQWLEIQSICDPGNLINCTQVFNPDKSVSMLFGACAPIDQGRYGGIGCGYGALAWESAYTSNDKHMYRGDNSWLCDAIGSYHCPYWSCVSWAAWERTKHAALLHKGQLPQTALLVPVIL
jgi:hypothetical protein